MGGSNKQAAQQSSSAIQQMPAADVPKAQTKPLPCEQPVKHWIGVRVEDEAGNLATDVTIHCKLSDAEFDINMGTALLDPTSVFRSAALYDPGDCIFSIPAVYDVEWWPKSGVAPSSFPDEQGATLDAGDCVVSGANKAGFRSYHTVWDCTGNNDLKASSPNPNQQLKGTSLRGPVQKVKTETRALDQAWTFVVRTLKPPSLQIILLDKTDKPLSGKDWEFTALAQKGTTGPDGKIKVVSGKLFKISADTLKVTMLPAQVAPTPAVPPVVAASDPPAYPPPVVAADFKDKVPDPDLTAQVVTWTLSIGALDPFSVHGGVLKRLGNLGFSCSTEAAGDAAVDGEARAIKAYNKLYSKAAAVWADLKDELRDRHDKP